ncbi:hypothetical protein HQ571_03390 [Candidatus Kuenenbacteria bacterium]|nr:hypothetical protein [Candidatus Kuenenbacteria bacterium]
MKKLSLIAVVFFCCIFGQISEVNACAGYGQDCSWVTWCCDPFFCTNGSCKCDSGKTYCGGGCYSDSNCNGKKFFCDGGDAVCCPYGTHPENGYCVSDCDNECDYDGQTDCDGDTVILTCHEDNDGCFYWTGQSCICEETPFGAMCGPNCDNECSPSGEKDCSDNQTLMTCGNYDNDSCLEWGNGQSCICVDDHCCNNECSPNDDGCNSANTKKWDCVEVDGCWEKDYTTCSLGKVCSNGNCVSACTNQCTAQQALTSPYCEGSYSKTCSMGNDGCFDETGQSCGYGCNVLTGTCNSAPTCNNDCFPSGEKECINSISIQTCGNYDADSCYEWGAPQSCQCFNDACQSCSDQCDSGDTGCSANNSSKWTCVKNQSDGCWDKSYTSCSAGKTCSNGNCITDCTNQCTAQQSLNSPYCEGNYLKTCTVGADGCYDESGQSCQYGCNDLFDICNAEPPCDNECFPSGKKECISGVAIQTCGDYNDDGCYEWGNPQSCNCFEDECQSCYDQCDSGEIGCSPDLQSKWTCVQSQIDGCWDKSYSVCSVNKLCSNGDCVTSCAPMKDHKSCTGNTLVWKNSCNVTTETIQDCTTMPTICNDSYDGLWSAGFCSSEDLVCYYGDDTLCECGCEDDTCIAPCCDSDCTNGSKGCLNQSMKWVCVYNSDTTCYEQTIVPCPEFHLCQSGECVCLENWACGDWSSCVNGVKTRECWDNNNCGTVSTKPADSTTCDSACEFLSAYWKAPIATDGEFAELQVDNNGNCVGETIGIEVWEKDWWILKDDFQIDYTWSVTSNLTTALWNAVYEHEMADIFGPCEGPSCLFVPEYYVKIYHNNELVLNTEDNELLEVHPFYADLTMQEFFDEIQAKMQEEYELEQEFAYYKCLNSQGTITSFCREMLETANVKPMTEDITEAWQKMCIWFKKGLDFFDPGYLIIAAISCGSCQSAENIGRIILEPTSWTDIFAGGFDSQDFSYPSGLVGPEACGICFDGLMSFLDNPYVMIASLAYGLGKTALGVGVKKTTQAAGVTVFEYTLDDFGRGAKYVYSSADDQMIGQLMFLSDDAGNMLFSQALYKNPIFIYEGGKEFVIFNAMRSGPIVEVTSLSKSSKQFFAEVFQSAKFQGAYDNAEMLMQSVNPSKFQSLKIKVKDFLHGKPYGSAHPNVKLVQVNTNLNSNYYGYFAANDDIFVMVLEHEFGHYIQFYGLKRKGYLIGEIAAIEEGANVNYALEYFDDIFMAKKSYSPSSYKQVIEGKLQKDIWDNSDLLPEMIESYKHSVQHGLNHRHHLRAVYNYADEVGDTQLKQLIEINLNNHYPGHLPTFQQKAAELQQAAYTFADELVNGATTPSNTFDQIVTKYKLNYWGTIAECAEGSCPVSIDGGSLSDPNVYKYQCKNENELWLYDITNSEYIEQVQVCGNMETCANGECVSISSAYVADAEHYAVLFDDCKAGAIWYVNSVTENTSIKELEIDFSDGAGYVLGEMTELPYGVIQLSAENIYDANGVYDVRMRVTVDGLKKSMMRTIKLDECEVETPDEMQITDLQVTSAFSASEKLSPGDKMKVKFLVGKLTGEVDQDDHFKLKFKSLDNGDNSFEKYSYSLISTSDGTGHWISFFYDVPCDAFGMYAVTVTVEQGEFKAEDSRVFMVTGFPADKCTTADSSGCSVSGESKLTGFGLLSMFLYLFLIILRRRYVS